MPAAVVIDYRFHNKCFHSVVKMGVRGLWQLLMPIGRRISIETLEGQILAVDASIWLTQFLKAMRDPMTGEAIPNAHIIGFLRRICKLLYHGIRPVFVFDGATPQIKLREIQLRRKRRGAGLSLGLDETEDGEGYKRAAKRLLTAQIKASKTRNKDQKKNTQQSSITFIDGDNYEYMDVNGIDQRVGNIDQKAQVPFAVSTNTDTKERMHVDNHDGDSERWDSDRESLGNDSVDYDGHIVLPNVYDESSNFDVERIVALPSNLQKDVIEKAKRAQRLQSRKEFMPVAANPDAYSATQLKNFLKTVNLNKKINEVGSRKARESSHWSYNERLQVEYVANEPKTYKGKNDDHSEIETNENIENIMSDDEGGILNKHNYIEREILSSDGGFLVGNPSDTSRIENDYLENQNEIFVSKEKCNRTKNDEIIARILQAEEDRFAEKEEKNSYYFEKSQKYIDLVEKESIESDDVQPCQIVDMNSSEDKSIANSNESPGKYNSSDEESNIEWEEGNVDKVGDDNNDIVSENMDDVSGDMSEKYQIKDVETTVLSLNSHRLKINQLDGRENKKIKNYNDFGIDREDTDHIVEGPSVVGVQTTGVDCTSISKDSDIRVHDLDKSEKFGENIFNRKGKFHLKEYNDDDDDDDDDDSLCESNESVKCDNENIDDDVSSEKVQQRSMRDGSHDALIQAQKTAANLTNWAGQAVRMAIADHLGSTKDGDYIAHKVGSGMIECHDNDLNIHHNFVSHDVSKCRNVIQKEIINLDRTDSQAKFNDRLADSDSKPTFIEFNIRDNIEIANIMDRDNRARQRDTDMVTDEMKEEIMVLLDLFGLPYLVAPAEAEAQCVTLETLGLVNGVVTEDSDAIVFGAKKVYKNIFDDKKYVEVYHTEDAQKELALSRSHFIALAMLLGGDYTSGVKGVGIVNGMEIIQAYHNEIEEDVLKGLTTFKQWLDGFGVDNESKTKLFELKHSSARTRWIPPSDFPSKTVFNAYSLPVVDKGREQFTWVEPNLDGLRTFCEVKLTWERNETDHAIRPILERLADRSRQTRLDSYFKSYKDNIKFASVRSKRLREAVEKMTNVQKTANRN